MGLTIFKNYGIIIMGKYAVEGARQPLKNSVFLIFKNLNYSLLLFAQKSFRYVPGYKSWQPLPLCEIDFSGTGSGFPDTVNRALAARPVCFINCSL